MSIIINPIYVGHKITKHISFESKEKNKLQGIKLTSKVIFTRLLFVDDVLLFGLGSTKE